MERQGWLKPNNEIVRVEKGETHQSKAEEMAKKMGIKISPNEDSRFKFIKMGYVLYCESCIIALTKLSNEQKKILEKELEMELPEVAVLKEKHHVENENER